MLLRAVLACLIFATTAGYAVEPNSPGNLGVIVALGESPQYIQRWVSTPAQDGAPIPRLSTIRLGQTGYAAFIVSGVSPSSNGQFSFSVSWKLFGPDGKLVFEQKDYAKQAGNIHTKPAFYMADPALDVVLEESDPEGEYILEAVVLEHGTGKTASGQRRFKFTK